MEYWLPIAHWIYDFQTLIAAVIALLAAAWTIHYIREQMRQANTHIREQMRQVEKHREDDLNRRHASAKIQATWSLLSIYEYCDQCLEFIQKSIIQKDTYKATTADLGSPPPKLDHNVFPALAELSTGLGEDSLVKVQNFVGHLQIQQSRLASLRDSLGGRAKTADGVTIHDANVLDQAVLDYYVMKFQTNRLLGYCRGDDEVIRDLQTPDDAEREMKNFPDFSDAKDLIAYGRMLWPQNGWWRVSGK